MTTIISLLLRCDSRRDTGELDSRGGAVMEFVPAFRDDVDLDALTPRARTLAEAVAQQKPGFMGMTDIVLQCDQLTRDAFPRRPGEAAAYGLLEKENQKARRSFHRSPFRSVDPMGPAEYLERQARTWPMDWYIVGAKGCDLVPSFEAGKADCVFTHDSAMEHLHLSPSAWDRLTQAGHLPAPDRWAEGRPHWYPETIEAYRTRPHELWPVSRIAEHLGYASASSARAQLFRWGLSAETREPGRSGENLFAADQVQALHAHRPGSGRRGAARAGGKFTVDQADF